MAPVLVLLLTLLIASILLLLFFKSRSQPVKGNTIIICGPVGSGKTSLFLKLIGQFKSFHEILHSIEENSAPLPDSQVLLVDQATKTRLLHTRPLDYFHFKSLAGIIVLADSIEILAVAVAVAIKKQIPLCLYRNSSSPLSALLAHFSALQKTPPSSEDYSLPVNQLLFENRDGDLADWEPVVKGFFSKRAKVLKSETEVREWIRQTCQ